MGKTHKDKIDNFVNIAARRISRLHPGDDGMTAAIKTAQLYHSALSSWAFSSF